MKSPNWTSPFRCQVGACQVAVGEHSLCLEQTVRNTPLRISHNNWLRPKKMTPLLSGNSWDLYISPNDSGVIWKVAIWDPHWQSNSHKIPFETDTQQKLRLWLEFLGLSGISKITLVKGQVHVLGDALSRNPTILWTRDPIVVNLSLDAFNPVLPDHFRQDYVTDQQLAPLLKALGVELPTD